MTGIVPDTRSPALGFSSERSGHATFKNGVLVERDDQPSNESGGDQQVA
jgi:hypothetical protein